MEPSQVQEKLKKGMALTLMCPECESTMCSTANLNSESGFDKLDINEFERIAVEPKNKQGEPIY